MSSSRPSSPGRALAPALLFVGACALGMAAHAAADAAGWKKLREDAGITTWTRDRADGGLPVIRSRTRIDASLWEVLAVLDDVDRACEWTAHCEEMRRVRRASDHEMWVYARIDAPWPVRDRDVLTHVRAEPDGIGRFVVRIESARSTHYPPRRGVVRMPRFRASYSFRATDEGIEVVYEADIDPGGALPDWVKRFVSRDLPHETLSRLRDRVAETARKGTYAARVRELKASAVEVGYLASN